MMTLPPEKPEAGPWRVEQLRDVVRVFGRPDRLTDRPWIVAIDGRSSAGKTTLARRVAALLPAATVVHTDDVAWWHARFAWTALLVDGVLDPVRAGRPVGYRPPAWDSRGRVGSIDVPYAGFTAWRGVTEQPVELAEDVQTWGDGEVFTFQRLLDGRMYWWATANLAEGTTFESDHAEALHRYGSWPAPIADLIEATPPPAVLRHDIYRLPRPLPRFCRGRVALLGDAARRPRAERLSKLSERLGHPTRMTNAAGIAVRNALVRVLPSRLAMASFSEPTRWSPPPVHDRLSGQRGEQTG